MLVSRLATDPPFYLTTASTTTTTTTTTAAAMSTTEFESLNCSFSSLNPETVDLLGYLAKSLE